MLVAGEVGRGTMAAPIRSAAGTHIDVLDGLRGIAILMVLWWHLWLFSWLSPYFTLFGKPFDALALPGTGLMGVELFFFISGFVLFYPYARHLFEDVPLQTVKQFAYRRFIKIVPSYVIGVFGTLLLVWHNFASVRDAIWQVVAHLLFIHTFWVGTWVGINGVLWSLGIEVQFYLIFPLVCWLFRRSPLVTYAAMVLVAVIYRILAARCCVADYVIMGQLPAYLDLFASGMLACWIYVWFRNRPSMEHYRWLGTTVAILAGIGVSTMLWDLERYHLYPPPPLDSIVEYAKWQAANRQFFGALLGVFTVASCLAFGWWRQLLANRITIFFGIISYNLYLWHQSILEYMLKHRIPAPALADPHADEYWKWRYTLLGLAITIGVATFITYAIERPLLKRGFRAITDLFVKRPSPDGTDPASRGRDYKAPATSDG